MLNVLAEVSAGGRVRQIRANTPETVQTTMRVNGGRARITNPRTQNRNTRVRTGGRTAGAAAAGARLVPNRVRVGNRVVTTQIGRNPNTPIGAFMN